MKMTASVRSGEIPYTMVPDIEYIFSDLQSFSVSDENVHKSFSKSYFPSFNEESHWVCQSGEKLSALIFFLKIIKNAL